MSIKKDFQKVNKFSVVLIAILFLVVPIAVVVLTNDSGSVDTEDQQQDVVVEQVQQSDEKTETEESEQVEEKNNNQIYQSEIYPELGFEYPESWVLIEDNYETSLYFYDQDINQGYEIFEDDNSDKFFNETLTLRKDSLKLTISTRLIPETDKDYFLKADPKCIENREFNKKLEGNLARVSLEYIYPSDEKEIFVYDYISGLALRDNEKFEEYYQIAKEDGMYGGISGSRDDYFACYLDYPAEDIGLTKTDYVYKNESLYSFVSVELEIPIDAIQEDLQEADKIVESLFADKQVVEEFRNTEPSLSRNWTMLTGSGTYTNSNLPDFSFDYDSDDWEVYVDEEVKDYNVLNVKLKDGDNVVRIWFSYMPYWEYSLIYILDNDNYDSTNEKYSWIPWKEPGWLVLSDRTQWFFEGDDTFDLCYSSHCLDGAYAVDKGMSILFSSKVYNNNLEDPLGMIEQKELDNDFLNSRVITLYQGQMTEEMQAKLDKFLISLKF